jgi:2-oxo-4-hydroxy-4-carboxy-5-ureidoimidazoline decarboxylase
LTLEEAREVFERSPWVAERAWKRGPFASRDALHAAMMQAVRDATREEQLALIRAHPELAGAEAVAGSMTAASTGEQGRLGFDRLPPEDFARMKKINGDYRRKFGFPCIVALKLHQTRDSVMAEMERRLANGAEAEVANALEQIGHIARGRLDKLA